MHSRSHVLPAVVTSSSRSIGDYFNRRVLRARRISSALPRRRSNSATPLRRTNNISTNIDSRSPPESAAVTWLSTSVSNAINRDSTGASISSDLSPPKSSCRWSFNKVIQPRASGVREMYVRCGIRPSPLCFPNDLSGLVSTFSQVALNREVADDNAVLSNGEAQGFAATGTPLHFNLSEPRSDAATPSKRTNSIGTSVDSGSAAVPAGGTSSSRSIINSNGSKRDSSGVSISSYSWRPRSDAATPSISTNNIGTNVDPRGPAVSPGVTSSSGSVGDNSNVRNWDSIGTSISSDLSPPRWRFQKVMLPCYPGVREVYVRCGFRPSTVYFPNNLSDSSRPKSDVATPSISNNVSANVDSGRAALPADVTTSSRSVGDTGNINNRHSRGAKISSPLSQQRSNTTTHLRRTNNVSANVNSGPAGSADVTSSSRPVSDICNGSNRDSRGVCIICVESDVGTVFLPCRHAICCAKCAQGVDLCPVCRRKICERLEVYFS